MTKGSAAARSDVNKCCTGGASSSSAAVTRHLSIEYCGRRGLVDSTATSQQRQPFCDSCGVPLGRNDHFGSPWFLRLVPTQVRVNNTSHAVLTPRAATTPAGNGVPISITQP